ncbi:amidohydrolase [Natranaerobius thermophilus]|uniref:Amidohydrolase 3 n=1 Tax=Natranaerobius thermophilus (strain ATCC BAA-1301 / DSM 18059 / JW/NM-WN-LF) TaxID=457570 RepID=B2A1V6_NATTJ|nr:amidohydrolase family protein [Natranaerobius thermophilus]ACB86153.1 Amidohydrolase 3 [Natranaerobius thermophilus JW/NM-WN-LF]
MSRKVYYSTSIFTADSLNTISGAVVVEGENILYVGDKAGAEKYLEGAEVEDLGDKTIAPGLIDSHTHFFLTGRMLTFSIFADPSYTEERIVKEMKELIKERPGKPFYFVWGYDPGTAGKITTKKLDEYFGKDTATVAIDLTGHAGGFSSKALELAGWDPNDIPEGSVVEYEDDGSVSYIGETLFLKFLAVLVNEATDEEIDMAIDELGAHMNKNGYTSTIEVLPLGGIELWNERKYRERAKEKSLPLRIAINTALEDGPSQWLKFRDDWQWDFAFHVGLKVFVDGVPQGSESAWLEEPYASRSDWYGEPCIDMDYLRKMVKEANDMGIGVRAHCTGDRSFNEMVRAFMQSDNTYPVNCIEHGMMISEKSKDLIQEYTKTKTLGVNSQPELLGIDSVSKISEMFLGKERAEKIWPHKSLQESGATVCFSSDCPNAFGDISTVFRYSVNRLADEPQSPYANVGLGMQESFSPAETLIALTANPAKTMGKENILGKLKPGFKADIAIFDQNIFELDKDAYDQIEVYKTVLNGKEVYEK